jgi:hypothetical protein
MPVIGFLNAATPDPYTNRLRGFHRGLKDSGYVEGENVTILYRWAENQMDRLPELAADLVRRQVSVIVTSSGTTPAGRRAEERDELAPPNHSITSSASARNLSGTVRPRALRTGRALLGLVLERRNQCLLT